MHRIWIYTEGNEENEDSFWGPTDPPLCYLRFLLFSPYFIKNF